ncbi:putative RNA-binding protein 15B [Erpetoichthys calabaricus]|uniref:putative RNA-binding protein 15B n=1 Tax=Erpetoichthys calabaricus TaxID=27687 RepID=UPI0022344C26|nr:putative RNA-binding protein 15B [Erpetoichthys calabaricus]
MKRQGERDSSPGRATAKRIRERDRDRESSRKEDGTAAASLTSESRNYHKHQARSRSREREKSNSSSRTREEAHHRAHHHDIGVNSRQPLRTTGTVPKSKTAPDLGSSGGRANSSSSNSSVEYKTLLISNLGSQLSDEDVEDGLFHEFKKFGDVSVKLSHTPELGRVAYVNFRHPDDAKEARHAKGRLVLYDRPLKVEPVYPRRRSCTPPDVSYVPLHASYPYRQRSLSPGSSNLREQRPRHYALEALGLRDRERALEYVGLFDEGGRSYSFQMPEEDLLPEDDQRATSNLFIGNLDHNVTESELRRAFDKYGLIEEVVIKRPARAQGGAYAFLKFHNLDMAHRAKVAMSGRVIGRNVVKIGYGKANPTTRLWVGGLGPNTSLAALAREFDRFGSIKTIDYGKGDSFAYIQYESLAASQTACAQMRGFPLGGPNRRLRVDFANEVGARTYPQQYQPPGPLPVQYDLLADGYRGLERELRARDRTPPHSVYPDRERGFPEGSWTGHSKSLDRRNNVDGIGRGLVRSRSKERWTGDRENERTAAKPWDDRRKRRSLSTERAYEERGRPKTRGSSPERSPDRVWKDGRFTDIVADTRDINSATPDGRPCAAEDKTNSGVLDSPSAKKKDADQNHRNAESEEAKAEDGKAESKKPNTLLEYAQTLQLVWHGVLVLKNSCFPTDMHLLEGGSAVVNSLLKDSVAGGKITQFKIAQRLRLDQPKLDEVSRRIKQGSPDGYAVLLAVQAPQGKEAAPPEPGLHKRLLRNLVSYLKQKQSAGVISLPLGGGKDKAFTGMLYAFPPCDFTQHYLQGALRTLGKLEEEHLVVVIVRDSP